MRRTETPEPIWIKFCTTVDIADVVTYTNFGYHRLRGFWVAGGQISPSPIDFHRRPYNTLALPCERVMSTHVRVTVSIKKNVDHKPPPLLLIPTSVRRSVNGQQYGMCVRAYKPDDDSW